MHEVFDTLSFQPHLLIFNYFQVALIEIDGLLHVEGFAAVEAKVF